MLTPTQVARRAARELQGDPPTWADPRLGLDLAEPTGSVAPRVAVVCAERVSATGDVQCDPTTVEVLQRASRVIAVMSHADDAGRSSITATSLDAPTARAVVHRIITELCVIDVTEEGLIVREVAPGVSAREVQKRTEAPLWAGPDLAAVDP